MLVILGAVLALMAGRQVASLFAGGEGWLPVSANVLRTRVSPVTTLTVNNVDGVAQRKLAGQSVHPAQSYRVYQELVYFVKGSRYSASLDRGQFDSRANALAALAQCQGAGSRISVWANANDPAQVVLQPVRSEAGAGAISVFALLGMIALQLGSMLIRSVSNATGAPVNSSSPAHTQPITTH